MEYLLNYNTISGIPLIEASKNNGEKKPLLIAYHGFQGTKEQLLFSIQKFCDAGFFVVYPEACYHGARKNREGMPDFIDAVNSTAGEVNTIIDNYRSHPGITPGNAGLCGYSMGGCITFKYLSAYPRKIQAACAVISSPFFDHIMDTPVGRESFKPLVSQNESFEQLLRRAKEASPGYDISSLTGIPLCLLTAGNDPIVPPDGSKKLYAELKQYACNEVEYTEFEGYGHAFYPDMDDALISFFVRKQFKQEV